MKNGVMVFLRAFAFTMLCIALISVGYFGTRLIDILI